jgi:Phasin protein
MNEGRKPELAETISSVAGPFVQVSSDATRRLCEQGQSVAKTISEWNTEFSHFVSHRVARNGEALGRMMKCQNFPEVFAIQSEWVRAAADDYLREMSKLMEANSLLMGSLMGSIRQAGMPSAAEMPTLPVAHSAFETPASPEARLASETHASPEVRLGPETRFQPATRSSPARSTAKAED